MRISGPLTGPSSYGKLPTTLLLALGPTLCLILAIASCGGGDADSTTLGLTPPAASTDSEAECVALRSDQSDTPDSKSLTPSPVESPAPGSTGFAVDPSPAPEEVVFSKAHPPSHHGAATASVEERIYESDAVVRASLISAGSQGLCFRVVEYLKGSGPTDILVWDSGYGLNVTWADREAVLFLSLPETESNDVHFFFTKTHEYYTGDLTFGHTIGTRNPVWLPMDESKSEESALEFITDYEAPTGEPFPTISLTDLRSKIAWVEGGEGVEGYDECIRYALHSQRRIRDWETHYGDPWSPYEFEEQAASGAAEGTALYSVDFRDGRYTDYVRSWLTGQDADLFGVGVVDDDAVASNGYDRTVTIARPLPGGAYTFVHHTLPPVYWPCDYSSSYGSGVEALVTVTAPAGTVHEAFFDPAAVGQAVGADGSNGVLKPAEFTVGETATTMQGLKWGNGSVVLTLSPYTSLTGNSLDFIALDGSVAFSLDSNDATADAAAGTLTWAVEPAPWRAGDRLMLRIR